MLGPDAVASPELGIPRYRVNFYGTAHTPEPCGVAMRRTALVVASLVTTASLLTGCDGDPSAGDNDRSVGEEVGGVESPAPEAVETETPSSTPSETTEAAETSAGMCSDAVHNQIAQIVAASIGTEWSVVPGDGFSVSDADDGCDFLLTNPAVEPLPIDLNAVYIEANHDVPADAVGNLKSLGETFAEGPWTCRRQHNADASANPEFPAIFGGATSFDCTDGLDSILVGITFRYYDITETDWQMDDPAPDGLLIPFEDQYAMNKKILDVVLDGIASSH